MGKHVHDFTKDLTLQAGAATDRYVRGDFLFLHLGFSQTAMTVSVGQDCPEELRVVSKLWSQTVWELENLAEGMRFVALGGLPSSYAVPSRDMLVGPTVRLWPALQFQLGHPGIGIDGRGTMLFCSTRLVRSARQSLVYLEAMNDYRSERATFEIEDVLAFAEELSELA